MSPPPTRPSSTRRCRPVRKVRTIHPSGDGIGSLLVYCPLLGHSTSIAACATCPSCEGLLTEAAGDQRTVACASTRREMAPPPGAEISPGAASADAVGRSDQTLVASMLSEETVCFSEGVPFNVVWRNMTRRGPKAAVVVDNEGRPLGVVCPLDLADPSHRFGGADAVGKGASPPSLDAPRPKSPGKILDDPETLRQSDEIMSAPVVVQETEPLAVAVDRMMHSETRQLVVTDGCDRTVGLVDAKALTTFIAKIPGK